MSTPVLEWMQRRWKAALAVGVGLALLLPVPAFALTWLSNWNVHETQTGGATPPNSVTSTDFANGGNLTIDMAGFFAPHQFSSQVTATREFSVNSEQDALNLAESFQTLQKNTKLKVNVAVVPVGGDGTFAKLNGATVNAGPFQSRFVNYSSSNTAQLSAGTYMLVVSVKYSKNRFLGRSGYIDASPFSFTFTGI